MKLQHALLKEMDQAILSYKDIIRLIAQKPNLPHFIFITPPTHKYFSRANNNLRRIQAKVLEEIVKTKDNMSCLKMIKFWNFDDSRAYLRDAARFTSEGLNRYWESVDSAIRY